MKLFSVSFRACVDVLWLNFSFNAAYRVSDAGGGMFAGSGSVSDSWEGHDAPPPPPPCGSHCSLLFLFILRGQAAAGYFRWKPSSPVCLIFCILEA